MTDAEADSILPSIYGLYDSEGRLRYIGKANNPVQRLKGHMREAKRRKTPLYRWIAKRGAPELRILEADCINWQEAERRLIAEARKRGDKLLNVADGGDEPGCSTETRSRNGKALVARIQADPFFRKIWHMKRELNRAVRDGMLSNTSRAKLRYAAHKRPDLFGLWLHLTDRQEEANGDPVGGYGKVAGGRYGAPMQAHT